MRSALGFLVAGALVGCTASAVGTRTSPSSGTASDPAASATPTESNDPSEPSDPNAGLYDVLFDAPSSSATTSTVRGLWAGTFGYSQADVRVKVEAGTITAAMRCRNGTIGVVVSAKVTESSIRVLESKSVGAANTSCSLSFKPVTIPKCESSNGIGCFTASDTSLYFSGQWLFQDGSTGPDPSFTKLSD